MKEHSGKQVLISVLLVAILLVSVIGASFAVFRFSQLGQVENSINSGTITMIYNEGQTGINITNAMPISDEDGKILSKENEMFKFSVSATMTAQYDIEYLLTAVKDENSTLRNEDVRLYLEKSYDGTNYGEVNLETGSIVSSFVPFSSNSWHYQDKLSYYYDYLEKNNINTIDIDDSTMPLYHALFSETETHYYILRMWLAEESYETEGAIIDGESRNFKITVGVHAINDSNY